MAPRIVHVALPYLQQAWMPFESISVASHALSCNVSDGIALEKSSLDCFDVLDMLAKARQFGMYIGCEQHDDILISWCDPAVLLVSSSII